MTAAATAYDAPPGRGILARFLASQFFAVSVVVLAIVAIWYVGAIFLNANAQRLFDERDGKQRTSIEFIEATWSQPKPRLPAPHQVAIEIWNTTGKIALASKGTFLERVQKTVTNRQGLFYHGWVTLSSTLVGFSMGTVLGIALATMVVHVRSLDRSLMPWIVSSQTVPILAIAPMIIVVFAAIGLTGLLPKALISTYLSFFPVTVGMVKGLRSPDPIHPRPVADLQRQRRTGLPETALAGLTALPVCLDEGGDRREPRRRHRRRTADRSRRRPRRPPSWRLLLRPDPADVGGPRRRIADGRPARRYRRPGRASGRAADGGRA